MLTQICVRSWHSDLKLAEEAVVWNRMFIPRIIWGRKAFLCWSLLLSCHLKLLTGEKFRSICPIRPLRPLHPLLFYVRVCFYPATKLLTVEKCNKGPLFKENERKPFRNKIFQKFTFDNSLLKQQRSKGLFSKKFSFYKGWSHPMDGTRIFLRGNPSTLCGRQRWLPSQ